MNPTIIRWECASASALARKEVALDSGLAGCYVNIENPSIEGFQVALQYLCSIPLFQIDKRASTSQWNLLRCFGKHTIITLLQLTVMPRVTRAALRSMVQHDESSVAVLIPLPQTPTKGRIPLGEIANNKGAESQPNTNSEERAAPAKKEVEKGKKRTTAKKAKTETTEKAEEACVEILEDKNQSTCSSAVEACQDLLQDGSQGRLPHTLAINFAISQALTHIGSFRYKGGRY